MVLKECGFNKSEKARGVCKGIVAMRAHNVTFSMLAETARDGELIKMQHFCHHVDTIRHPISSYVTTKLYGTSTMYVDATIK